MINSFVTQIEKEKFQVIVDLKLYSKEALVATCYKYTGSYYVYQCLLEKQDDMVCVIFESKDCNAISEQVVKQFCNDLIDQQIRYVTNLQFGHIRDLIVEEAFKPVNTKQ
jgi:His-Xaa-Ser system protein HxsD